MAAYRSLPDFRANHRPPRDGEERDSGERTMGVVKVDVGAKKLSLQDLYPPATAEERDSGERTMGVG
jgi:hypothetical protein